ncbi:major facilitator superfamily domain-containing protein [Xylariaceae sp. FL0255]|nr:major facilitator superfamily domain-containing protein [Xylariaceae sp. FL0255]
MSDNMYDEIMPAHTTSTSSTTKRINHIQNIESTPVSIQQDKHRIVITEASHPEALATSFSNVKKWVILCVIFLVQCSMNFNTSLYANGQKGIVEEFHVSSTLAVAGAAIFLIFYAFGCELWAPWSEEFGRWIVLQCSLGLVNICCLPVALAPQGITSILVGRAFGGLFSAGGSVTLGMVADLFVQEEQENPLSFVVLSSVGGSIFGPIVGGFVEHYLPWRWTIWVQLMVGVVVQLLHFCIVPETRATVRLDRHARMLRKKGTLVAYGPTEHMTWREYIMPKEMFTIWARPFQFLFTEPIVLVLSLLSGFSDALIFMQIQSFGLVFSLWHFTTIETGFAFIPIGFGYLAAYLLYFLVIRRNRNLRAFRPADERAQYESRMWWLLYTAPMLPIGLFFFAWTSTPTVSWIWPLIGTFIIGIANWTIYMTTIDYMVAAYGPYSASATGGNGFARDFLAGVLTCAAAPYYAHFMNSSKFGLQIANSILGGVSVLLVIATFAVYRWGPSLRKRSPFAQSLLAATNSNQTAATAEMVQRARAA